MDLKEKSTEELKALGFDAMRFIQINQSNLSLIERELISREQEEVNSKKPAIDKEELPPVK